MYRDRSVFNDLTGLFPFHSKIEYSIHLSVPLTDFLGLHLSNCWLCFCSFLLLLTPPSGQSPSPYFLHSLIFCLAPVRFCFLPNCSAVPILYYVMAFFSFAVSTYEHPSSLPNSTWYSESLLFKPQVN